MLSEEVGPCTLLPLVSGRLTNFGFMYKPRLSMFVPGVSVWVEVGSVVTAKLVFGSVRKLFSTSCVLGLSPRFVEGFCQ